MKNPIKLLAIFVLMALIGFSIIACGDDPNNVDPDNTSNNNNNPNPNNPDNGDNSETTPVDVSWAGISANGAAVTIKVINAELGSYQGTNAKYTDLNTTIANSKLTINNDNNSGYPNASDPAQTFAYFWHSNLGAKGFAIVVNTYDTDDTFSIMFHSITFKP